MTKIMTKIVLLSVVLVFLVRSFFCRFWSFFGPFWSFLVLLGPFWFVVRFGPFLIDFVLFDDVSGFESLEGSKICGSVSDAGQRGRGE